MNIIKKTVTLCLFLSTVIAHDSYAQKSQLESYYPGGAEQFWSSFQEYFSFPSSSLKSKHYGTALINITLNSDGVPARILFLNQVDVDLVKATLRSLTKLSHNWSDFPKSSSLYLSIRFSYNEDYITKVDIDKSALSKEFAEFSYIVDTRGEFQLDYKKDYAKVLKSAKNAYKKAELKTAKSAYSKLIAINPYQADFYKKRIEIEAFMGSKVYACTDIKVLKGLLNYSGAVPLHGCN